MSSERPSSDFGARLKEARLRKNVSLRAISDVTRISVAVLEALERNDISKMPGGIFSRAIVRAYAREVGIDSESMVEAFLDRFPHDSVTVGHTSSIGWEEMQEAERRRRALVRGFSYATVIAVVVGVLGYFLISRTTRPLTESATAAMQSVMALARRPFMSGTAPAPASVASSIVVELVAVRACSGSAAADTGLSEPFVLVAGDRRRIVATQEVTLALSEADAVEVTINGKAARLGSPGESVSVRLATDNVASFTGAQ